jgi:hypothetical protein
MEDIKRQSVVEHITFLKFIFFSPVSRFIGISRTALQSQPNLTYMDPQV